MHYLSFFCIVVLIAIGTEMVTNMKRGRRKRDDFSNGLVFIIVTNKKKLKITRIYSNPIRK